MNREKRRGKRSVFRDPIIRIFHEVWMSEGTKTNVIRKRHKKGRVSVKLEDIVKISIKPEHTIDKYITQYDISSDIWRTPVHKSKVVKWLEQWLKCVMKSVFAPYYKYFHLNILIINLNVYVNLLKSNKYHFLIVLLFNNIGKTQFRHKIGSFNWRL